MPTTSQFERVCGSLPKRALQLTGIFWMRLGRKGDSALAPELGAMETNE
jgi:hypothetical protein